MEKLPKLNKAMICKTVKHIEEHLEQFNMGHWYSSNATTEKQAKDLDYCGTTACFAGWCALINTPPESLLKNLLYFSESDKCVYEQGISIQRKAKELLGFTEQEAAFVFRGDLHGSPKNQLRVVKARLNHVLEQRGEPERFKV